MKKNFLLFFIFSSLFVFHSKAQTTQVWSTDFNGRGDYTDKYKIILLDNAQNVVVAGYTVRTGASRDWLLRKLNSGSGSAIWTRTVEGLGGGADEINAMVLDASGNIFITGYQKSVDNGDDIVTQKYDTNGNLVWSVSYDNIIHGDEAALAICLDNAGNVIVTGETEVSGTPINTDNVTIQYSPTGTQNWVKTYNNGIGMDDKSVCVNADNNGNVYIAGTSANGTDDDMVVIKYDNAGTQLWKKVIDRGDNDKSVRFILDASANIYLTGRSKTGGNYDYYVIKYDQNGIKAWDYFYDYIEDDRPADIAIDATNSVYITGISDFDPSLTSSDYNYSTLKLNPSGSFAWSKSFAGSTFKDDLANAVTLDASGNVYVVGTSEDVNGIEDIVSIKYSSAGTMLWIATYAGTAGNSEDGNDIAVDNGGNIYVAGAIGNAQAQKDALLLQYKSATTPVYESIYNGLGDNSDNTNALLEDAAGGFLYATGYSVVKGEDRNICTMKLDAATGDTIWTSLLGGSSGTSPDEGVGIVKSSQGYIFAAGFVKNSGFSNDIKLIRYNPATGDTVWTRTWNGAANGSDKAVGLGIDAQDNLYIAGKTTNTSQNGDILLLKYNVLGVLQWAKTYTLNATSDEKSVKMAVSGTGDVWIAGTSGSLTDSLDNIIALQYNAVGTQVWVQNIGNAATDEEPTDIAIDNANNAYICGFQTNTTNKDYIAMKFDLAGGQQWQKTFNGAGNQEDVAEAIAVDNVGNVIVTGESDVNPSATETNFNVLTIKYDAAGTQKWNKSFSGPNQSDDFAADLQTNSYGEAFIGGKTNNGTVLNVNYDFLLVRYDSTGTQVWTDNVAVSDSADAVTTILLSGMNLYVGGNSWATLEQKDIYIMKYAINVGISTPEDMISLVVYPNPVSQVLHFETSMLQNPTIELFNALGQMVAISQNDMQTEKNISVLGLPAGMYFYQVKENGKMVATGKVVKE
jgi:uncharacterized delta-60 repeat protein